MSGWEYRQMREELLRDYRAKLARRLRDLEMEIAEIDRLLAELEPGS